MVDFSEVKTRDVLWTLGESTVQRLSTFISLNVICA